MKKYGLIAAVALVTAVLSFALLSCGSSKALNVNDVASDPSAFTGKIKIAGVMAGTSKQDPSVFGIMDIKELQCTTVGCNKLYVPARCNSGVKAPVPGDEVVMTGSFTKEPTGMIFAVEKIVVVRNHKIGG